MKKIIALLLFHNTVYSQRIAYSVISTFGTSNSKNGIIFQQSLGQSAIVSNEINLDKLGLRQGFIQPTVYSILKNDLRINLFPNPNQGVFSFNVELDTDSIYEYFLLDGNGKLVVNGEQYGNEIVPISILYPVQGIYFLNIIIDSRKVSYKIIVTN